MARPIFIVRVPTSLLASAENREAISNALYNASLSEEYFITLVPNVVDNWQFEVLNVEEVDEIKFEELENKLFSIHEDIIKKGNLN